MSFNSWRFKHEFQQRARLAPSNRPRTKLSAFSGGKMIHTSSERGGLRGSQASSSSGFQAPVHTNTWLDSLRQTFLSQQPRQQMSSWEEEDDELRGAPPVQSPAHRTPYTSHLFERMALEPSKK
ncbi:hypothetical protein DUNSADRAFT_2471 [Dunaliella salina]|uniref:Encoded protein n=1 Tax=Dunaliella salina TaxID=3046 RepID=A0ABQ7GVJ9_DUNSA|nr:hypothetical protein DUNSADRAFT_2471 [Dunaliella salina]|eukprot:KAF5838636.1 hypothetical protein DUNSADRAFT_2471 [Dunaliella salina]